jgi:hypothetical protein
MSTKVFPYFNSNCWNFLIYILDNVIGLSRIFISEQNAIHYKNAFLFVQFMRCLYELSQWLRKAELPSRPDMFLSVGWRD